VKEKLQKILDQKWIVFLRRVLNIYGETSMGVYAGYATLYIMTAAFPLLMLVIAAVNMMPGFTVDEFTAFLFQFLPDVSEVRELIYNIIQNLKNQSSGLIASVAALTTLWSASGGVTAIQKGLINITKGAKPSLKDKPRAVLYTFLFVIMIILLLVFNVLGDGIYKAVESLMIKLNLEEITDTIYSVIKVSGIVTIFLTAVFITLVYTYLPGKTRPMKNQIPGAVLTTVLWMAFSAAFAWFIPKFWNSSIYGSLASIFLIIMWMKVILSVLFAGAAVNEAILETKMEKEAGEANGTENASEDVSGSGETEP